MTTNQLIEEAISLPVEERALVVDSLLRSLNQPDTEVDSRWATLAQRRLMETRNGSVQGVPGDQVFQRIWHWKDRVGR